MLKLLPVSGCRVKRKDGTKSVGRVDRSLVDETGCFLAVVSWPDRPHPTQERLADLVPGFSRHMHVQDVPRSLVRASLGIGTVQALRELGGYHQVLVDFPDSHEQRWLPYETLRHVASPMERFVAGQVDVKGGAERFRLRNLAHAIETWHENTGGLSHLDIDPLPHQIHLVHHILASGNLNWLIADDVGLGKTIEVGMLLSALDHRKAAKRVLIVCPAGLAKQWQEELRWKFGFDGYQIYGADFQINESYQWRLHDKVIASVDRLKQPEHLESLLKAEPWDLVVFDEAHRLSRRQYGMKLEASDRYALAAELRQATDSLLLLSATPHQGMPDKFAALLELLRPELKSEIDRLATAPDFLSDMVFRNQKAYVTDAVGKFIFNGKHTIAVQVAQSAEEARFDRALRRYLSQGYDAGRGKGNAGKAIGFVMTTYRKLAASSLAAIHRALQSRLDTLFKRKADAPPAGNDALSEEEVDERFVGEWEESVRTSRKEFFDGEIELLTGLLAQLAPMLGHDRKLRDFLDQLLPQVLKENPAEKILIFSEYRATQDYLADALGARFGPEKVNLLNGTMSPPERIAQIQEFEGEGQFLISTEAGGEGINLQRRCHVMVNFDLPWNPMRLVQRIGRLYRYGQQENVVVFNVMSAQTLDADIVNQMYEKLNRVVADLSAVSAEYRGGDLEAEILGEFTGMLEVEDVLADAQRAGVSRTQAEIDKALERARNATRLQRDLFKNFASFDPQELKQELAITQEHVESFVLGMCKALGIDVRGRAFKGRAYVLALPEAVQQAMKSRRNLHRVTFDRMLAQAQPELELMDLRSSLLAFLLTKAKDQAFGGQAAGIRLAATSAVVTAMLRWQNTQGKLLRQEFTAVSLDSHGNSTLNDPAFADWLLKPAVDASLPHDAVTAAGIRDAADRALDRRLSLVSGKDLFPASRQWVTGARAAVTEKEKRGGAVEI
jgi:superfamily II DNA or RNA helicase